MRPPSVRNSVLPSRLHLRFALNLPGRSEGEGGRGDPPVEPELSPLLVFAPTDSAEEPPFPVRKPPITWNVAVVLVDLAITSPPVVELALSDSQPIHEVVSRQLGTLRPAINVIDHSIASVVGDPGATQSPPSSFFS